MKKLRTQALFFSVFFLSFLSFIFGCAFWRPTSSPINSLDFYPQKQISWVATLGRSTRISVVTANVENLFDTEHDPGKLDYEFLPKSIKQGNQVLLDYCQSLPSPAKSKCRNFDWSNQVLEEKIRRLRKSLMQNDPQGPDLLLLQEVENQHVLNQLADQAFPEAGYKTRVLLEGQDPRGIDPALLSKFPLAGKAQLHQFRLIEPALQDSTPLATRGLLQVPLQTPWGRLQVFVLHLPSQHHSSQVRKQALHQLIDQIHRLDPEEMFLVGGDFNISAQEELNMQFYSKRLSDHFEVSHLWSPPSPSALGTTNFKGVWSFFDVLLFPKSAISKKHTCHPVQGSIQVLQQLPIQKTKEGFPKHFRPKSHFGISDHFPVRAEWTCPNTPETR